MFEDRVLVPIEVTVEFYPDEDHQLEIYWESMSLGVGADGFSLHLNQYVRDHLERSPEERQYIAEEIVKAWQNFLRNELKQISPDEPLPMSEREIQLWRAA